MANGSTVNAYTPTSKRISSMAAFNRNPLVFKNKSKIKTRIKHDDGVLTESKLIADSGLVGNYTAPHVQVLGNSFSLILRKRSKKNEKKKKILSLNTADCHT